MAIKVTMPKLSDTMDEGVISKWLKKEGDRIEAGQVIAEAESDKATMELEAFDAGILRKILIPDGGKVAVGGVIAIIGEEDEDLSEFLEEKPEREKPAEKKKPSESPQKEEKASEPIHAAPVIDRTPNNELLTSDTVRIKASPLARKLAQDEKIDLRKINGTGTGGRIIRRDILQFLEKRPEAKPGITPQPEAHEITLNSMRETIAKRMVLSKTTVPHFYATMEIDMGPATEFRKLLNTSQSDIRISYNDLLIKSVALALKKHPAVNASFSDNKIMRHNRIDIGVAVALEDGLITPVVRNADSKSIGHIARDIREMADRAKERKLTPQEYTNATFTISNLGMYGVEDFVAIINPPEAAILAVGGIKTIPVVKEGEIQIGNRMNVTLSCDHRAIDGAQAALFLRELKKWMENPYSLVL
ncbi:pyruvate dehydrogenase complex dihydrolipoamide acetyltransferase [candidate division KSB1 bacterium]|nr:pyruvate dehydrogenase complex dihydrolipoamide acetyltransferase [candidate division KSB1 bacterium]